MKKIFAIVVTITGTLMAIAGVILKVIGQVSLSAIDGADGSTSIFFAGKIGGGSAVIGIFAGIILVAAGIIILVRVRHKNQNIHFCSNVCPKEEEKT